MENKGCMCKGTHSYEDGSEYTGVFSGGKPHGKGKMIFANNDIYEGDWCDGKMHGRGNYNKFDSMKDKFVESYSGEFVNGVIQGQGRIKYENHSIYQGQWQNGMRTGIGTLWISSTEYAHGLWKFDEFIRGVRHFDNGDWYEGSFRDGKFHGYGRYFYASGVLFDGEFENGSPKTGIEISPDGSMKSINLS